MGYLMWHTLRGLHKKITISFMVAGHTRCLVDGCFGLFKQKFRRPDVFTLEQLAHVVDSSASCNVAQLLANSGVVWRNWDTFLQQHFLKIAGVSKAHHFMFDATKPELVTVKDRVDAPARKVFLLKTSKEVINEAGLPEIIPAGGLTVERQRCLHKDIRPHVPAEF